VEINAGVLTASQGRLLEVLQGATSPMTLAELEAATGLHANTLRGHLSALADQQRVTRVAVRRSGRGRPAWGYLAREPEYAALALALAEGLDTAESDEPAAMAGGRAWGTRLRERLAPGDEVTPRDRVLLALEHTGFAPEADDGTIRLTACPLLEAARAHPDVVCRVHLGLVEGVLGRPGARLLPRPDTLGCRVVLP
jgi:predicted ArsR family transcriptional regulator